MFLMLFCFSACGGEVEKASDDAPESEFVKNEDGYYQITPEQAHEMMLKKDDYTILDVREESEYKEGHIRNAVLLPDYEVLERASEVFPDKNEMILVYCRSGRRSKNASAELAAQGYVNVYIPTMWILETAFGRYLGLEEIINGALRPGLGPL